MTRRGLVLGLVLAVGVLAVAVAQQPPLGKIERMADGLYRIPGQGGATAVYLGHWCARRHQARQQRSGNSRSGQVGH
jgi:hypothetical protein